MKQQLEHGIRYLDLRVVACPKTLKFKFCHALYGHEIQKDLKEVAQFLTENRQEVVILDFNHLYGITSQEHFGEFVEIVESFFQEMIWYPPLLEQFHFPTLSLSVLNEQNKQVLIFCRSNFEWKLAIDSKNLKSLWPNKNKKEETFDFNQRVLEKLGSKEKLYVTQCIMTPRLTNVISLRTRSLCDYERELLSDLPDWLQQSRRNGLKPNIITTDFIEQNNFASNVLDFN